MLKCLTGLAYNVFLLRWPSPGGRHRAPSNYLPGSYAKELIGNGKVRLINPDNSPWVDGRHLVCDNAVDDNDGPTYSATEHSTATELKRVAQPVEC